MKQKLPSVFNAMTTSYKAYWFISILECINEDDLATIPIKRLCSRMLTNAWYPIHYFRLNLGAYDLIETNNLEIKRLLNLDADIPKPTLLEQLFSTTDVEINRLIMHFYKNVPFRFLSPWIKYTSDLHVEEQSKHYTNDAPYSINRTDKTITINPNWLPYLKSNYVILKDYGYWKLANYIQSKNPGVPDVINKLTKPANRGSLQKQRDYWNVIMNSNMQMKCIYTDKLLTTADYDIEHYIPWSFTTHNLLWNLVPANSSINSSKGSKLPNDYFLPRFVDMQKVGLTTAYHINPNMKLFEDYAIFGTSVSQLIALDKDKFYNLYLNIMQPQLQLAKQLGFQDWEYTLDT